MPSRALCSAPHGWCSRRYSALLSLSLAAAAWSCGDDAPAPTEPPLQSAATATAAAPAQFRQVSAGEEHTCGVTPDDRAYCWGRNEEGELGDGTTSERLTPVPVATALRFRQIRAGFFTTCAVTTDYRAFCWGSNARGEIGDGTTTDRLTPVAVAGGHRFRQVDTKFEHGCGVSYPDNRVFCWGWNFDAQLGNNSRTDHLTPVGVSGGLQFSQVSTGYYHTCGITTDRLLYCWGFNRDGQVGDGISGWYRLRPSRVGAPRRFRDVDGSRDYTCAVAANARAYCWGNGASGQLGNGTLAEYHEPRAVAGGLSFERVSTGAFHACGETTLNVAYCWGSGANGELGDGTRTDRSTPVAVSGNLLFSELSAGSFHTCGRTPAAKAYCWGRGFAGQLGDGTAASKAEPVAVGGGT
jgi:alpha-tubulin suppressor-like RCC1 family protein